ncbi:MAG: CPBP family intramembrane metalloprotease [Deltaproteobacteria bacterium]|nr:CPBP family intramembrane metalloprotease [Deltaproteobacteria bacterium]
MGKHFASKWQRFKKIRVAGYFYRLGDLKLTIFEWILTFLAFHILRVLPMAFVARIRVINGQVVNYGPRINLMNYFPDYYIFAGQIIGEPAGLITYQALEMLGPFLTGAIVGPFLEELLWRLAYQKYLLTVLPAKICELIGLSSGWVTCRTSKIIRVFLIASLFTCAHVIPEGAEGFQGNSDLVGYVPQMIMGLILSSSMEYYGKFRVPLALHILANAFPSAIAQLGAIQGAGSVFGR